MRGVGAGKGCERGRGGDSKVSLIGDQSDVPPASKLSALLSLWGHLLYMKTGPYIHPSNCIQPLRLTGVF